MGRSERDAFFERLVAMRDGYAVGVDDRASVLSVADAIRYTEAILVAIELDAEPWVAEPEHTFVDGAGDEPGLPPYGPRFASDLWPWPTRPSRSSAGHEDTAAD
jgi:hypothetical protein